MNKFEKLHLLAYILIVVASSIWSVLYLIDAINNPGFSVIMRLIASLLFDIAGVIGIIYYIKKYMMYKKQKSEYLDIDDVLNVEIKEEEYIQ